MPTDTASSTAAGRREPHRETIKETFVSIIIAFVLAFVFRGFVVEAFVIPTGSMAPTLMGAHMRFRAGESGYSWPVGPWKTITGQDNEYEAVQTEITVHDPMTGQRIGPAEAPRRSGDRILVLKFLYGVREPQRFDVVVFKCPYEPATNFIKRLIGLPGEQVALVDGDVFVRDAVGAAVGSGGADVWSQPGWHIARKPARVQQAVWQEVFDSRYAPLNPMRDGRAWYNPPWAGSTPGWTVGGPIYRYDAPGPTRLEWDARQARYADLRGGDTWDIDDRYAYNEMPSPPPNRFPVSDVRLRAGVEPLGPGLEITATVAARNHEFEAAIAGSTVTLRMRGSGQSTSPSPAWRVLEMRTIEPLVAGRVTDVEFWHVDQSLQLWIAGSLVASATYDWTPAERILNATGREIRDLLADEQRQAPLARGGGTGNIFATDRSTRPPQVRWSFSGSALRLHRVGLDRDLHYQQTIYGDKNGDPNLRDTPALATHPRTTLTLGGDEFFVCGDNSPASKDGRLWDTVDPWVRLIDPKVGVVPRDLMIGKAFFVYFPSLHREGAIPVPDFGRLRFIR